MRGARRVGPAREDGSLTRPESLPGDRGPVTGSDGDRVVVVRAWLHADRLIIRVLAGRGPDAGGEEWVFADIVSALDRLAVLLDELRQHPDGP